ncbi:hypothetical protein ACQJBY_059927 [Aegilops geniculata]
MCTGGMGGRSWRTAATPSCRRCSSKCRRSRTICSCRPCSSNKRMGTGMVVVVMMRNLRSMPLLLRIAAPWPLLLRIAAPQSSSCDAITRTLCRTCSTSFA